MARPQSRPALELCPRMRVTLPCTPRNYLVVLGPSKEVTRPEFWRQPSWNDKLLPPGSGIERGLYDVSDVPQLPCPCPRGIRDFLPLVQKPAPLNKWKKGVHQLLLWVG